MFNFSPSTYIIAGLLIICLVVSGLLYHQIGKTAEAEAALVLAIDANTNLQKSLELKEQSCDITDKLLRDLQAQNNDIEDKKNNDIDKLNKIPSKSVKTSTVSPEGKTNESNVADIDDALPPELISLLKSASSANSEGVDSDSR